MHVDPVGQPEHRPEHLRPGPRSDDDCLVDLDVALGRLDAGRGVVRAELESGHLGVLVDLDALGEALVAQTAHRLEVEGEASLVLV